MRSSGLSISVVIPHLNQPSSLRNCLKALAEQRHPRDDFEIIVVDNGSKESPETVTRSFEGVILEQEVDPGPGPARNRGVTVSNGSVVAFVDADCIADRDWVATIARCFKHDKTASVIGGDVRIALEDPERPTMLEAYECVFAYRQKEYIEKHGFSGTGNLAVRRHVLADVGPFVGIEYAEDREWGRRALAAEYELKFVADMIVYHPARTTFRELFRKWDRQIDHDFSEWTEKGLSPQRWILRAIAVGMSPLAEVVRIASSSRISGPRAKSLALFAVVVVRGYRAGRMIVRLFRGANVGRTAWNRS